jgi:hypothetical protein
VRVVASNLKSVTPWCRLGGLPHRTCDTLRTLVWHPGNYLPISPSGAEREPAHSFSPLRVFFLHGFDAARASNPQLLTWSINNLKTDLSSSRSSASLSGGSPQEATMADNFFDGTLDDFFDGTYLSMTTAK